MDIGEIIKAAAEPADRLIDAVSHAIGMAYEPRYIRRKADAKAYEIEKVAKAIRDNTDLPIKYTKSNGVSIDTLDCESLIKRAGIRLAYQEVIRQENMEDILDDAYVSLLDVHTKSEKEISREWMNRFLDFAGDISTDELKHIWSKVLAGEVIEPSSFSLRTLDCLRNISSSDAKLFAELCRCTVPQQFMINAESC